MILAILQARMSSSRLPGKVMKPILGMPMLYRQIERVRRCQKIDQLVIATSTEASDDILAAASAEWGVPCVRGSISDVLARFIKAIDQYPAETVVRLTGDCPLADPDVIDATIGFFQDGGYDYASNVGPETFPDGLDVEVARAACLKRADREAMLPVYREHVMPYLRLHPALFKIGTYQGPIDLSAMRWTVDEAADFEFVTKIYERLYPTKPDFRMADILELLKQQPALEQINAGLRRNATVNLPPADA